MSAITQANYVLVDGVLRPDALAKLHQRGEPLEVEPLYSGTRWEALHDLGPLLVWLRGPTNLARETFENATHPPDASLLYSPAPIKAVADHLRRFLAPAHALGGKSLLRFADPLIARYWLGSYEGAHLDAVLGPIAAWHVPESPHTWAQDRPCHWQSFLRAAPAPEWAETHAQLGQAQLRALEHAARWQFMERLYSDLRQSLPQQLASIDNSQLTQWLQDRLDEAQAWGLVSEHSLVIWIEYSLRWGDGFAIRPDGPYQRWLDCTPNALNLAPEVRIQHMDDHCLRIEMTKEV